MTPHGHRYAEERHRNGRVTLRSGPGRLQESRVTLREQLGLFLEHRKDSTKIGHVGTLVVVLKGGNMR